jgi:radical SAM-linked protein
LGYNFIHPQHNGFACLMRLETPNRTKGQPVDTRLLEDVILRQVFKPGRYMGIEQGAYRKPFARADVTMAFAFPDLYEIGISNYGLKMFYSLVNQLDGAMCDRVYAPAMDMKQKLAEHDMPLYGVESKVPLKDFDLVAFSLQYELNYTTILGVLEAARIPFRAVDRPTLEWPVLVAGGPGCGNPMAVAPFFDAFIIGDGEDILVEMLDLFKEARRQKLDKPALMARLGAIEGIYIPGKTERAYKRIVDIGERQVDIAPLIPAVAAVHDRVVIEARRGCDRMCRFCQPCFINLPVREQSIENIKESALKELEKTGYEECSLLSLSIADYSHFKPLILEVADVLKEHNASLSLSSQRADQFSLEVAQAVQSVRKSTLTFAPEAGTARMRDVVNKNLTDAEIVNAVTSAYRSGWNKVKLYFMIGLPTETNADLDGIVDLVKRLKAACAEIKRDPDLSIKNTLEVNLTLSNFVPKPHTPFQWFPQDSMEMLREKITYLKQAFKGIKGVKLNFTDPELSKLEAVISKAGPELADVLELAYQKGAYLDAWDDILNFQKWYDALAERGIDVEAYTRDRLVNPDDPLPWDAIDMGLDKNWLKAEYERATAAASTTPCFEACSTCGVCATYSTWPKFMETPKKKPALKIAKTQAKLPMSLPPVCTMRVKIEKRGKLRFISHLDWLRMVHRSIMRAKLPVAYSQGFNPKPRIAFGPALPLFTEGLGEYIDIDLTQLPEGQASEVCNQLNRFLPEGGKALEATLLPPHSPSIDRSLRSMDYQKGYMMKERVRVLAAQETLPVEYKTSTATKIFDIAPYLSEIRLDGLDTLYFKFSFPNQQKGNPVTIKPEWLLSLIDPNIQWSVTRLGMELEGEQVAEVS